MSTTITDNFQLNAPLALDNKYGIFTGTVWRPYNDVTEANTTIASSYRYIGLTVSVLLNGVPTEYWYIGGIANANLLLKLKFNTTEFLPEWFGAKGDGVTDDTSAITAAITAAANNTLVFTGGKTYMVSALTVYSPLTIAGNGTLKKISSATEAPIITINSSDVNITDITVDGDNIGTGGRSKKYRGIQSSQKQNILITNVHIKNTYNEGIWMDCCSNLSILNCHIENCQQKGDTTPTVGVLIQAISTGGASDIIIADCLVDQTTSMNGCIKLYSIADNVIKRVKLSNNTCLMGDMTYQSLGIECFDSPASVGTIQDLIIDGNIIECTASALSSNIAFGISIGSHSSSGTEGGVNEIIVSNNIIRNCRKLGIEVIGNYITVIGNEIIDSAEISINSDSVAGGMRAAKIIGNTTRHTGGNKYFGGIRIQAVLNDMHGTLIEGNVFDGVSGLTISEDIIYIKAGGSSESNIGKIYNLSILNNHILEITRNGINMDNSVNIENLRISGNSFKYANNGQTNFYCIYSGAISIKNLSITNNTFICYIENAASNGNGLKFNAFGTYENVLILGNIFSDAAVGVIIAQPVDGLIISQNIFDDTTYPLQLTAASVNVISNDNVIKGGTNTINSAITYINPLNNTTSTSFTSSSLNTTYPLALVGQMVVCPALNLIYQKMASGSWVSYPTTAV
jgi:hypothetical protein